MIKTTLYNQKLRHGHIILLIKKQYKNLTVDSVDSNMIKNNCTM